MINLKLCWYDTDDKREFNISEDVVKALGNRVHPQFWELDQNVPIDVKIVRVVNVGRPEMFNSIYFFVDDKSRVYSITPQKITKKTPFMTSGYVVVFKPVFHIHFRGMYHVETVEGIFYCSKCRKSFGTVEEFKIRKDDSKETLY